MKTALVASLFVLVLFAPTVSLAAGVTGPLVPGNTAVSNGTANTESKGTDYTLCDLLKLANNVINFAVAVSVFVATLAFAYGGVLYITGAAGGEAQIKKAHKVLLNAVLGILIILLSWLIVNIVVSVLTTQSVNFWTGWFQGCPSNSINTNLPTSANPATQKAVAASTIFPSAGLAGSSCVATSQALAQQVHATANCNPAQRVANYGTGAGVVSTIQNNFGSTINQCASEQKMPSSVLVAISAVECGGKSTCTDPSNTSTPCAVGGYGATQVSCSEVRSYCSSSKSSVCSGVSGLSDAQLVSKIQSTPSLSFCATAYTMNNNYSAYGDWALAADAYNGGAGALAPSASCPGYLVMQCPVASGSSQFPYCTTTCAYNDIFSNYMNAAGGTGMNFEEQFKAYMALAGASPTSR